MEEEERRRQENEDAFKIWLEKKDRQRAMESKKVDEEKRNSSQDTNAVRC